MKYRLRLGKCPVCKNYKFNATNETCLVCGWKYDWWAYRFPGYIGINNISLNEAKECFKHDVQFQPLDRELGQGVLCPVCKRYVFKFDYDICSVCGWESDPVQNDDHNYWGGANELSVNDAREAYKKKMKR